MTDVGERWDEQYRDATRYRTWPSEEVIRFLVHRYGAAPAKGQRVLDLGCGAGGNLWALLAYGLDAYGVDPSTVARAEARRVLYQHLREAMPLCPPIYHGTADAIPFPDGFFDAVIEVATLQHVMEPGQRAATMAECRRVLAPHGQMLSVGLLEGTEYIEAFGPGAPVVRLLGASELADEWSAAGMSIVAFADSSRNVPVDGQMVRTRYGIFRLIKITP